MQGGEDKFQLDQNSVVVKRGDTVKVTVTLKQSAPISNPKSEISNSRSSPPSPAIAPFDAAKAKEHQAAWAKHLGVPVEITNSIGMKLVLIPPGEFMMGSTPEEIQWALDEGKKHKDPQWFLDSVPGEGPQHRVRLTKPFRVGMYHVTQGEYEKVMEVNPSEFTEKQVDPSVFTPPMVEWHGNSRLENRKRLMGKDTSRHPVETVTWDEAMEFCRRLSALPAERAAGRVYRLPTEAKWEYACRAGTTTRWYCGDDRAGSRDVAWTVENSGGCTHPVGEKKPNAWRLYDMHGNVRQWCWLNSKSGFHQGSATDDPEGLGCTMRGGDFGFGAIVGRSASRCGAEPEKRQCDLGFRVCLVLADTAAAPAKTGPTTDTAQPSGGSPANKPSRVELEPEPVAIKPGKPLSEMAIVVSPAALPGVRSWSIETIGPRADVSTLAYSPDGSRLATAGMDGTVRIWDPATGKLLRAILGANHAIESLCWSPDGRMLAFGAWLTHKATILDVQSGSRLSCDVRDFWIDSRNHPRLRWSPDGGRIAYHRNDEVAITTFPPGDREVLLRGVGEHFSSLAWSPDGSTMATCSEGGGTLIWDTASGTQRKKLATPRGKGVAWSPDGTMLAVAGEKAEVWDAKTWQIRHSFPGSVSQTAWSPDSRTVAFGGVDCGVETRDIETASVRWTRQDFSTRTFGFSPDGRTVAVGRLGEELLFLDAETGEQRDAIPVHRSWSNRLAFSPDGSQLASGNRKEMRFWDVKTGSHIGGCHPRGVVTALAWSADGKTVATSGDGTQTWDARSRECVNDVPGGLPWWAANGCPGVVSGRQKTREQR